MPVLALGVSHHQATVDDLTRFTACAAQAADELRAAPGVRGLITLATCNRCELYIEADGAPEGLEELFTESVAAALRGSTATVSVARLLRQPEN